MLYALARAALFRLPPEMAHRVTLAGLHAALAVPGFEPVLRWITRAERPTEVFGLSFANPVGLAAGFDKNVEHVTALAALGFGFVEVGSITAQPWPGNARPRLFRLPADRALINRMGLNNGGAEAAAARLTQRFPLPVCVNVAKTPDESLVGAAAVADYAATVARVAPLADAVVLNVSCPNADDGRTFEDPAALDALLGATRPLCVDTPLLVKVSPDLERARLRDLVQLAVERGADGFTATNTTVQREGLRTRAARLEAVGRGGLSGAPLHRRAVETVGAMRAWTDKPIVGVGGVDGPDTAQAFFDAGANLVQLYTGFVYGGPRVVRRIVRGLR
jgi:dihydroorotate dehydrogenase